MLNLIAFYTFYKRRLIFHLSHMENERYWVEIGRGLEEAAKNCGSSEEEKSEIFHVLLTTS